eukprot:11191974-Lingulodinium_polyedra.AAC.1
MTKRWLQPAHSTVQGVARDIARLPAEAARLARLKELQLHWPALFFQLLKVLDHRGILPPQLRNEVGLEEGWPTAPSATQDAREERRRSARPSRQSSHLG